MFSNTKILLVFIAIIFLFAIFIITLLKNDKNKKITDSEKLDSSYNNGKTNIESSIDSIEKLPYRRKYLLTKNEFHFYKVLNEIAEKIIMLYW